MIVTANGALIVDYATPQETLRCIECLPEGMPVVVVDNYPAGRSDNGETWEAIERRAEVLRPRRNLGLSGALNLGFGHVDGDVLVLNPDVSFQSPSDVNALYDLLLKNENAGIVAPRLVYGTGEDQASARKFPTLLAMLARRSVLGRLPLGQAVRRKHLSVEDGESDLVSADWVLGAAMWIRRSALDAVGGFDDRFFLYNEDIDFCARLWRADWHVLQARRVVATHGYRRDSGNTLALWQPAVRSHLASMIRLILKYPASVILGRPVASKVTCSPHPVDEG